MFTDNLVGRRVKVVGWYDHEQLVAVHRRSGILLDGPEGTVTDINEHTHRVTVRIEGNDRLYTLPVGDVEVLP
jgi:hypothetical protein